MASPPVAAASASAFAANSSGLAKFSWLFGGAMLASDRALVCDNVTSIKQGDTIQEGAALYIVVAVDIKAPTSDVLAYILQLRLK